MNWFRVIPPKMMVESISSRQTWFTIFCIGLSFYFVYHAIDGRHGLAARTELLLRASALEQELGGLERERSRLDRQISLIGDRRIERDMLEEQARLVLNFVRPDEIVVVRPTP